MPALTICPVCQFSGNHGFVPADRLSGISFYHDNCQWWLGIDGKKYTDRLDAFFAGAKYLHEKTNTVWHQAMIARINGKERLAQKLFKQWKLEFC